MLTPLVPREQLLNERFRKKILALKNLRGTYFTWVAKSMQYKYGAKGVTKEWVRKNLDLSTVPVEVNMPRWRNSKTSELIFDGQFTLSTQVLNPNVCVTLFHRRNTTVPLFIFGCIKMLIKSEPELFLVEVDMRSTTTSELLPVGYFPEKWLWRGKCLIYAK